VFALLGIEKNYFSEGSAGKVVKGREVTSWASHRSALATGPKTPEGKARALAAMREGWKRWRAERRSR
jgi:hypothetical protein